MMAAKASDDTPYTIEAKELSYIETWQLPPCRFKRLCNTGEQNNSPAPYLNITIPIHYRFSTRNHEGWWIISPPMIGSFCSMV